MERHEHPAQPQQPGEGGFAEGADHKPDPPEEELEPDFARGTRSGSEGTEEHHGRFSEGNEAEPEADELREGRFSTGIEADEDPEA